MKKGIAWCTILLLTGYYWNPFEMETPIYMSEIKHSTFKNYYIMLQHSLVIGKTNFGLNLAMDNYT